MNGGRCYLFLFACIGAMTCETGPLPAPVVPGTAVRQINLTNCEIAVLPIREREPGMIEQLHQHTSNAELCFLASSLKHWMESLPVPPPKMQPGDWARIRSFDVYRIGLPLAPGQQQPESELHLYADIPGRPQLIGVSKSGRNLHFFLTHRGGG